MTVIEKVRIIHKLKYNDRNLKESEKEEDKILGSKSRMIEEYSVKNIFIKILNTRNIGECTGPNMITRLKKD